MRCAASDHLSVPREEHVDLLLVVVLLVRLDARQTGGIFVALIFAVVVINMIVVIIVV